jgi:hypothetical protein
MRTLCLRGFLFKQLLNEPQRTQSTQSKDVEEICANLFTYQN